MILIDYNGVAIGMMLARKEPIDENIIRPMIHITSGDVLKVVTNLRSTGKKHLELSA